MLDAPVEKVALDSRRSARRPGLSAWSPVIAGPEKCQSSGRVGKGTGRVRERSDMYLGRQVRA